MSQQRDLRNTTRAAGPREEMRRLGAEELELDKEEEEFLDEEELDTLNEIRAEDDEEEEFLEEEEFVDEENDDPLSILRREVVHAAEQLATDDEEDEFDDSTEHGWIANALRRRDPSISKARASFMATARRAAASGIYAKIASRVTTDSTDPSHQGSPNHLARRAEMDRRARVHRSNVNAEIEAMHGAFGREREERRRVIDKMVTKLREVDRHMPHTVALQKIRRQYPGLF
jgi:hypothetical protein